MRHAFDNRMTRTQTSSHRASRRGVVSVLFAFLLVGVFAFVAFAVDTGMIALTQTEMQNAVDAAALAAAQEIVGAITDAGESGDTSTIDSNSIAVANARDLAEEVALANGIYIEPLQDVEFGKRTYNEQTATWSITWGVEPYNVVRVTARRDQEDLTQPDGKLPLSFGWAVGRPSVSMTSSASAFIESRDVVVVLDFSGSMNDDSEFRSIGKLEQADIESNMEDIYTALEPTNFGCMTFEPQWLTVVGPTPTSDAQSQVSVTFKDTIASVVSTKDVTSVKLQFTDGSSQTFTGSFGTSDDFAGTGSKSGKPIKTVWVTSGAAEGETIVGAAPTSRHEPQIEVTFYTTSIYVESSKDLSNVVLEYEDGVHQKFDNLSGHTGTFAGTGSNAGKFITNCWIKSGRNHSGEGPGYGERFENPIPPDAGESQRFDDTNENVELAFCLDMTPYPYASGSWDDYIDYVRGDADVRDAGYRKKYGGMTFVNYLLENKNKNSQTADLWKTPHYPFHAVKNGLSLFLEFLSDLDFGDEVGLVTYDEESRVESFLDAEDAYVDLGSNLISSAFADIDTIQRHKQAGHYGTYTGMGYGVQEARHLLVGNSQTGETGHSRFGARHTIILMTDGQANRYPSGWRLPSDFDWAAWTDYDGDGDADFSTNDRSKQYAFWEATESIRQGITIHTMSVGAGADRDLMKAIAFAGRSVWIDIPGGSTIAEMESQLLDAFGQIAAHVPPPRLIYAN